MKKIIILDFSDAEVYIKDYDDKVWQNAEDFLSEHGFRESDCQWMIVDQVKFNID
jgi:hypothetical protein